MPIVDFAFDYASPWSFLANALAPRLLAGVSIRPIPVYLRGFEAFAKGMPYSSAKLAYLSRDFQRCAAHEGVSLAPPAGFPINGVHALRGAIGAQRAGVFDAYHQAMFRAAWQESRDISDKQTVIAIGRAAGFSSVADALDDPDVKTALRENTERAAARGAFGVPSFFVGDELFWGHDRMHLVAEAARAATGATGATGTKE